VLGGILVAAAGSAPAFAIDAASFATSAAALALMGRRRAPAVVPANEAAMAKEAGPGGAGQECPARLAQNAKAASASEDLPDASAPCDAGPAANHGETSIWRLFLHARVLQAIVLIAVLANFVVGGAFEVALPALAHARFGAAGYGALIGCFGGGSLAGTLTAARLSLRRPALGACASYLTGGVAISLVPFLGGLAGAAAAALVFGATAGFGNVIIITLLQQWAPARLLGRVMGLVMLASIGTFPASVALSGVIVGSLGPAPFFPAVGAVLAAAVLLALTLREFRDFGAKLTPPVAQAAEVAAR